MLLIFFGFYFYLMGCPNLVSIRQDKYLDRILLTSAHCIPITIIITIIIIIILTIFFSTSHIFPAHSNVACPQSIPSATYGTEEGHSTLE